MSKNVLIVSKDTELLPKESVSEPKCTFITTSNIETSNEILEKEQINLVLLDVSVSSEIGQEIYKNYMNKLAKKEILVHLLVDEGKTKEVVDLIKISNDFSTRPINPYELMLKIKSLLYFKELEKLKSKLVLKDNNLQ